MLFDMFSIQCFSTIRLVTFQSFIFNKNLKFSTHTKKKSLIIFCDEMQKPFQTFYLLLTLGKKVKWKFFLFCAFRLLNFYLFFWGKHIKKLFLYADMLDWLNMGCKSSNKSVTCFLLVFVLSRTGSNYEF